MLANNLADFEHVLTNGDEDGMLAVPSSNLWNEPLSVGARQARIKGNHSLEWAGGPGQEGPLGSEGHSWTTEWSGHLSREGTHGQSFEG